MLLPHFKAAGANFRSIATASGVSAHDVGKRFGFELAVSSAEEVLEDNDINLVVVGTRHDLHAELATKALQLNKHVFVEKPLALTDAQLDGIASAAATSSGHLMVGFNRRFSPLARQAKELFAGRERRFQLSIVLTRVEFKGPLDAERERGWRQNSRRGLPLCRPYDFSD